MFSAVGRFVKLTIGNRYCVLQRYIDNVRKNEKRIVLAGGVPIAFYQRIRIDDDHRGNLMQGASMAACELTADENYLANTIGRRLVALEVRFTALDVAFPHVIEINMVNPGGIPELYRLTGEHLSGLAVANVVASIENPSHQDRLLESA